MGKFIQVGERVKVISGPYEGMSGVVMGSSNPNVSIFDAYEFEVETDWGESLFPYRDEIELI